ncbi:hypothetical protein BDP27DRAFT_1324622, partial [Rhodocollybia butyracea]
MLTMKYLTPSAIAFTLLATSLQAYSAAIPTSQSQVHAPSLPLRGLRNIRGWKTPSGSALGHHVSRELGATHYAAVMGTAASTSQVGRRDVDGYSGSEYLGRRCGTSRVETLEKRAGVGDSAKLQLGTEVKPNPPTPDPAQIVPHYPEPDLDSFVVGGMMFPHPPKSGRPAKEADSRQKLVRSHSILRMRFPHPPKSRRPAEEAKLKADPESFDPSSKPPAKAQPVKAPPAKAPPAKALPAEAPPAKARLAKASPKYSFFPILRPLETKIKGGHKKGLSAKSTTLRGGERREGLLD